MPRDGSGAYTLPGGNPVVSGTTIDSVWANTTMTDFATQLNNVLTRDGLLGPTAPFRITAGSAGAPSLTFGTDLTSGMYRVGLNQIGFSIAGTLRVTFDVNGINGAIGQATPAGGTFLYANTIEAAIPFSATLMSINCALSNVFRTTFTANVTVAPTFANLKDGQTINWFITQDATGGRTMTWPASFRWPAGSDKLLSTGANAVDLLVATYRAATGFWYVSLVKTFAP